MDVARGMGAALARADSPAGVVDEGMVAAPDEVPPVQKGAVGAVAGRLYLRY